MSTDLFYLKVQRTSDFDSLADIYGVLAVEIFDLRLSEFRIVWDYYFQYAIVVIIAIIGVAIARWSRIFDAKIVEKHVILLGQPVYT